MDRYAELALHVLRPLYDSTQDFFCEWAPGGAPLSKVRHTKLVLDERFGPGLVEHDQLRRHYAATHVSGSHVAVAPAIIELPPEHIVAILAHEFGHVVDSLYPADFSWPVRSASEVVHYVGPKNADRAIAYRRRFGRPSAVSRSSHADVEPALNWASAWTRRTPDQVEWAADGIVELATGRAIRYAGPRLIQTFATRGRKRPVGLR